MGTIWAHKKINPKLCAPNEKSVKTKFPLKPSQTLDITGNKKPQSFD